MKYKGRPVTILLADDDSDDCLFVRDALMESGRNADLRIVEDGEALLDYLYQRGEFEDPARSPRPELILLDLNMPRKDGREALKEIKSDSKLRSIPVVVLTTSREEEDIHLTYHLGANSFIVKPDTFDGLLEIVRSLGNYWFEVVDLPSEGTLCKQGK